MSLSEVCGVMSMCFMQGRDLGSRPCRADPGPGVRDAWPLISGCAFTPAPSDSHGTLLAWRTKPHLRGLSPKIQGFSKVKASLREAGLKSK